MEHTPEQPAPLSSLLRLKVLWSLAAGLFWATFLWGIWDMGPYALGINAFVFLAITSGLFLWLMKSKGVRLQHELHWLIPLGLMAVSYLLFDNPFLKFLSFALYVPVFAFFANAAMLEGRGHRWDDAFLTRMVVRGFTFLEEIWPSLQLHGRMAVLTRKGNGKAKRVVVGVLLFAALSLTVVIPLLSQADAEFAKSMSGVLEWFSNLINSSIIARIFVACVLSMLITAAALAWTKPHALPQHEHQDKHVDPIITGIVIGGTLGLYLLFLGIQAKRLWVGSLPFDFKSVEQLVKSGFWQLLCLSFLNIVIYVATYRKTVKPVQHLLLAFSVASLLLLASAAQRMGLYVTYYGFSYEKFFASYTVLYCALLLLWLISRMFTAKRVDIARFTVLLFLWMYGLATVFPVEQFVLRANVALAARPDTQIRLYEMTMLSTDVLGTVRGFKSQGLLNERAERHAREMPQAGEMSQAEQTSKGWDNWIVRQENLVNDKHWYEYVLSNLF